MYGVASDYQKTANDEILVIPMIETQEAVDNIDAILDVPGIDAIYVGPSDLSFSLGEVPRLDRDEPKFIDDLREADRRDQQARPVRRHPLRLDRIRREGDQASASAWSRS